MVNMFLFSLDELDDDGVWAVQDPGHVEHLLKQLHVEVGDSLQVGVLGHGIGKAVVCSFEASSKGVDGFVKLRPENLDALLEERPGFSGVGVVLAVPRPRMLVRIMQTIATMKVDYILLVKSARVEKSFFKSRDMSLESIERNLRLGLEQGVHTRLPVVKVVPWHLKGGIEKLDGLAAEVYGDDTAPCRLLADPTGKRDLITTLVQHPELSSLPERIVFAIGPEGGWIDEEIEELQSWGFLNFHMGDSVLRTETAMTAVLAQASLLQHCAPVLSWTCLPDEDLPEEMEDGDTPAEMSGAS